MAANLEIGGAVKRTQKGDADWYYGGDAEAWANLTTAKTNIPASVRPGKTIGVFISGSVVEYWWPTAAVADTDLVAKVPSITTDAAPVSASANPVQSGGVYTALAALTTQTYVDTQNGATLAAAKTYADALITSAFRLRGDWSMSGGLFPVSGGSAADGAVRYGNAWRVSQTGSNNGIALEIGDFIVAIADNPGQTSANWTVLENNDQQATELIRGTVKMASQTETNNTDPATADDTKFTTVKKLWTAFKNILITIYQLKITTLANNGSILLMADNSGNVLPGPVTFDPEETDGDIIAAVTDTAGMLNDGYTSANNYTSTVTPADQKIFLRGKYIYAGATVYYAKGDNLAIRWHLS
jgi:hypothetical protein